jgi:hypothetical protein
MTTSLRGLLTAGCLLVSLSACKSEPPATPGAPGTASPGATVPAPGSPPAAPGGGPSNPEPTPPGAAGPTTPGSGGAPGEPAPPTTQPPPPAPPPAEGTPSAPVAGGKALIVVGTIPLVGTDVQIRQALMARKLEVQEALEAKVTAADAADKRVVVLSFSMQSGSFAARKDFAAVKAPIIVLEHFLLPVLGMTTDAGHGFEQNLTQLTIAATDPVLSAGFPAGDLTVYARTQEMFWGVPGPGAVKIAAVKGKPDRWVLFGYPKGAMMADRPAPARRLQFFFAVHAPPPVTQTYLNDNGLKLLGSAIDWSMQEE